MLGTPTLFTPNGSMLASRCVSVICFRFSRLINRSPQMLEMSNARMIAIKARNDVYPNIPAPGMSYLSNH